jgi:hypothetical protein
MITHLGIGVNQERSAGCGPGLEHAFPEAGRTTPMVRE